jgi:hypothetical protein
MTVIPQLQAAMGIWRGCWKNFIVPPLNAIYRNEAVLAGLSEATTHVIHSLYALDKVLEAFLPDPLFLIL